MEDFHRVTEGGSTEHSSQYYCDKVREPRPRGAQAPVTRLGCLVPRHLAEREAT